MPLCVHLLDICNSGLGSHYSVVFQNVIYVDGIDISGLYGRDVLSRLYYVVAVIANYYQSLGNLQVVQYVLELFGLNLIQLQLVNNDELVLLYSAGQSGL